MRVLFVAPNLGTGGAERQWSLLLPELRKRGVGVRLVTLDGEGGFFDELRETGIPAACARMRDSADAAGWRRALAIAGSSVDLVITRGLSAHYVGHVAARRAGARHVAAEHTFYDLLPLSSRRRTLLRAVASRVDAAVALSPSQVAVLVAHGYRRERVRVVRNGVDAAALTPSRPRQAVRAELGLADDDVVAILVATLRPEKRVSDFAEAAVRAHARDRRIRGVVVGGGPGLAQAREAARRAEGSLLVLGERHDVPDLLGAADLACLTSDHEGVSMTLLEAMAAGLPLVATDVGATADLVVPGETGILVPPRRPEAVADAFLSLAADATARAVLGRGAAERQQTLFSADVMADGYAALLEDLRPARHPAKPSVALVGTDPRGRGGVASVMRATRDAAPLAARYRLLPVVTHAEGASLVKLAVAAGGLTRLALVLARGDVDLVHLHASASGSLVRKSIALALARAAGVPAVVHVHGGGFERQFTGTGLTGALRRRLTARTLERADAVIALSEGWAERLARRSRIGRLVVVPNAPDLPARSARDGHEQGAVIAFVGRIHPDKAPEALVEATAVLRSVYPDLRLVLAGEGPGRAELDRRIRELGLDGAVALPGWLDAGAKRDLLAAATCFALPSLREGLPLALLEAMAAGVPVVASAVGGIPEAVRDGVEGLVVPPGDSGALVAALARILADPALARRLGAAARRRVAEAYSPAAFAARLDRLYAELLETA